MFDRLEVYSSKKEFGKERDISSLTLFDFLASVDR
jgi:hypothetical protein